MQNAGKKVPQGVLPEQHENVSHGDILLPVNSYHCIVPDTYTELSLHWHEEMEITLIREGMSDYRVGQEAFRASSGDLILVPPVTLHSAMELPGEIMVSDSLVFHLDYLGASGQDLSASAYLRPLLHGHLKTAVRICENDPDYEAIRDTFLLAHRCFTNREKFYELHLKDLLLRLLYLLFSAGYVSDRKAVPADRETRQQLKTVLRFIGEHYPEHMTIAELASLLGFSESYFMSFFRRSVGMSCIRYINEVRIRKAAEALENTARPVMEIAMDSGFDNVSYFNLQVRRRFGMTPREFRAVKT